MKTAHDLVLAAKAQCTEVAVEHAQDALRSVEVIIDVREADEYAAGHLAGSINIPRGLLEFKLSGTPELERRDISALLYCKTGGLQVCIFFGGHSQSFKKHSRCLERIILCRKRQVFFSGYT